MLPQPRFHLWLAPPLQVHSCTRVPFAVVWKADGRVAGSTRLMDIRPRHRGLEIGWTWYRRDLWGGPVNPECKYLLLRHAFEQWGAIRVCLKTDVLNTHSQNAIRKVGAKYEGRSAITTSAVTGAIATACTSRSSRASGRP